jgi:type II secretory pathway component GspD/PulD (secretin)
MRSLSRYLLGVALLLGVIGPAAAAPPPDAAAKIQHQLEQPAVVEFVDTPLADAVGFLAEKFDLPLHIDQRALDEAGLDRATPITLVVPKPVKLSTILRLIGRRYDVAFVPDDDILLLTTVPAAEQMLVARVYPVADLMQATDVPPGTPPVPGKARRQYDELLVVIKRSVAPDSWVDVGGPGEISSMPELGVLVILQTPDAQQAVARLLDQLRAAHAARQTPQPAQP